MDYPKAAFPKVSPGRRFSSLRQSDLSGQTLRPHLYCRIHRSIYHSGRRPESGSPVHKGSGFPDAGIRIFFSVIITPARVTLRVSKAR